MPHPLPDIDRLEAFVAAVELGSISAAVKHLHVTQPALSARLKSLEEGLGCQLLERTGRGVHPTPLGKLVYPLAKDVLSRLDDLQAIVQRHLELGEGSVHLCGGPTAIAGIFPQAISAYLKEHPKIQFTVFEKESADAVRALQEGLVDIGVLLGPVDNEDEFSLDENLVKLGMIPDSLVLIAHQNHPLAEMSRSLKNVGKNLLPIHVSRQKMIFLEKNHPQQRQVDNTFRLMGIRSQPVMRLRTAQHVLRMVEQNIGLGVVSQHIVEENDHICVLDIQGLSMERSLWVCAAKGVALSLAAQSFIQVLGHVFHLESVL
jgi:DNA-binding transcriptional LysR family regulator